jgi:hypothetical protein
MWARGPGLLLGALKYQYCPSNGMTIGLDVFPIVNEVAGGLGGTIAVFFIGGGHKMMPT